VSRFARHHLIDCFDQDRLLRSRILVVGAGAIGNEVLKNLALIGIGAVHLLDPDVIEESNLTRSVLFREADLGRPKAEVAAAACTALFPGGCFTWSRETFWHWASLVRLREFDAVIAATDNFESRLQLNQLCRLAPVDLFNAAIDSRHVTIESFPFRSAPGGACYECTLPASVHRQVRARYSCGGLRHLAAAERKVPTTAVTASHAGAGLAGAAVNALNAHPARPPNAWRRLLDSVDPFSGGTVAISQSAECPGCSGGQPNLRLACHGRLGPLPEWAAAEVQVTLSNPVILGTTCRTCGVATTLVAAAEDHDTTLTRCTHCGADRVLPDIRDQLTLGDLARLPAAAHLPVKYLVCHSPSDQPILIEINP
jgi:molybdopterin/thiamine biosynthesis adenylyltransferase